MSKTLRYWTLHILIPTDILKFLKSNQKVNFLTNTYIHTHKHTSVYSKTLYLLILLSKVVKVLSLFIKKRNSSFFLVFQTIKRMVLIGMDYEKVPIPPF